MSIRKMKIQQGYIVYQIPAEEIGELLGNKLPRIPA